MKKTILLLILVISNFSFGQIQNGLVAAFKFQGNLNDESTSNLSLTNNNVSFDTDNLGNSSSSAHFNGNGYLSFNSNAVKVQFPLTISCWINIPDVNVYAPIFFSDNNSNNYQGYFLQTIPGGQVGISYSGGTGSTGSNNRRSFFTYQSLSSGTWHHISAIINSTTNMKIYIDCQLETGFYDGNGPLVMNYSNTESRIGGNLNNSGSDMVAKLDELMIWNRELNANELSSLCSSYLDVNENQLLDCKLFPNPVRNTLNIELDAANEIKDVIVYDNMGRAIIINELDKLNNSIDLSQCPDGVLLIEIHTSNGIIRRKVVKVLD